MCTYVREKRSNAKGKVGSYGIKDGRPAGWLAGQRVCVDAARNLTSSSDFTLAKVVVVVVVVAVPLSSF